MKIGEADTLLTLGDVHVQLGGAQAGGRPSPHFFSFFLFRWNVPKAQHKEFQNIIPSLIVGLALTNTKLSR